MGRTVNRSGFSLVELMVVLVLIGVMTAMIIPEMKGTYEDALLRSTGRKLVAVANLASSRAIAINQPHTVRLDRKTGQYFIDRPARDKEEGGGLIRVRDVPGGEGELDTRIALEIRTPREDSGAASEPAPPSSEEDERDTPGQNRALVFYPDGTAEAAEIVLRDRQGFGLALRINPTTARVRVVELERE